MTLGASDEAERWAGRQNLSANLSHFTLPHSIYLSYVDCVSLLCCP